MDEPTTKMNYISTTPLFKGSLYMENATRDGTGRKWEREVSFANAESWDGGEPGLRAQK
ncbi:hypothetical protein ACHAPU_005476 [Fusarium lateritium]